MTWFSIMLLLALASMARSTHMPAAMTTLRTSDTCWCWCCDQSVGVCNNIHQQAPVGSTPSPNVPCHVGDCWHACTTAFPTQCTPARTHTVVVDCYPNTPPPPTPPQPPAEASSTGVDIDGSSGSGAVTIPEPSAAAVKWWIPVMGVVIVLGALLFFRVVYGHCRQAKPSQTHMVEEGGPPYVDLQTVAVQKPPSPAAPQSLLS